jgi:hypothetical protein
MYRDRNLARRIGKRIVPGKDTLRNFFKDFFSPSGFDKQYDISDDNVVSNSRDRSEVKQNKNESYYRDKLAKKLKGKTEVVIPSGRIDILTSNEIIEVKRVQNWKGAIGQIMIYSRHYPRHQKRIHLFGDISNVDRQMIEKECQNHDVVVTWEDDED